MKLFTPFLIAAAFVAGGNHSFAEVGKPPIAVVSDLQDRHLAGFHAVSLEGSFDVIITQGSTESVKVEASADEMDRIVTEVKNGVLKIRNKNNSGFSWDWGSRKRVIYVNVRNVDNISVSGSGDVLFKEGIRANDLALRLSGSGDVSGNLNVRSLTVSVSGSGDIRLSGRAETSAVQLSGSGDYSARALVTTNTAVKISGSGDASVNVSQELDASISGSGDINYAGGPKIVNKRVSGSGDVNRI